MDQNIKSTEIENLYTKLRIAVNNEMTNLQDKVQQQKVEEQKLRKLQAEMEIERKKKAEELAKKKEEEENKKKKMDIEARRKAEEEQRKRLEEEDQKAALSLQVRCFTFNYLPLSFLLPVVLSDKRLISIIT